MNKTLQPVMLAASVFVLACIGGMFVAYFEVFPYPNVRNAIRTFEGVIQLFEGERNDYIGERVASEEMPAGEAAKSRWTILDPSVPRLPIFVSGGLNQFLELCPERGCLGVSFDAQGEVTGSWPYRPVEIYAADITEGAYPRQGLTFDPRLDTLPFGVERYADGDILVNFQSLNHVFPFGTGLARVGPDGTPRWSRFDYSHHWSRLRADGTALVPSLKIGESSVDYRLGSEPAEARYQLKCVNGKPQLDIIQVVDGAGRLREEIELVPLLVRSNWAGLLRESTDYCDPLHLNYIDEIKDDAGPGLKPGDLVVSLRNISRFAILDGQTRQIKRVVAGGFVQQHAVQHLAGSKFLIFDNLGGDALGPPSRIVELDIATGVERRVFPNAQTPEAYAKVFSHYAGHIEVSPDRSRILASFSTAGRAFEVEIATGRLLAVYDNLHDVSSIPDLPEEERERAMRFRIFGMRYITQ